MPTLERIRQFEKALVKLGAEPEILAERGEEIEEVAPPDEGIAADLHELLAPPVSEGPPEEPAAEMPAEEYAEQEPLDTLDLGALGIGDGPSAEAEAEAAPAAAELDLETAPPVGDEAAEGAFELPEGLFETGETESGAAEEPASPDEAFELPAEGPLLPEGDFELPTEGATLPEAGPAAPEEGFETPEVAAPGAPGAPGESPASAEDEIESFELPEGLDLGPSGEEVPTGEGFELPEPGAEPAEAAAEEPSAEAFELPEGLFEDIETPEPAGAEPEGAGLPVEEPAVEEEPLAAEPSAGEAEAFELPDLAAEPAGEAAEEISFDEGAAAPGEEAAGTAEGEEEPHFELPGAAAAPGEKGGLREGGDEDEDFVIDEFSLPGMEQVEEEPSAAGEAAAAAPAAGRAARPASQAAVPPPEAYEGEGPKAEYTDEEFERIRDALATLPLSLRVAVEEAIGGRKLPADAVRRLVDLLIDGGSASEIARALSQATGVRVSVPRGVEKGTGLEFERERGSIGYLLRRSVLPALRTLVPVAGLLVGLWFATYETILKPLQARRDYKAAIEAIGQGQYDAARGSFNAATGTHAILKRMLETAAAYRTAGEFGSAGDIYERLIGTRTLLGSGPQQATAAERRRDGDTRRRLRLKPLDRRAVLPYAEMRTYDTMEYAEAETLLTTYLEDTANMGDYRALLALGDNYLEWASEEERRYDDAASAYRRAIKEQSPVNDEPIVRMLRYYARTGKVDDVETLVRGFESKKKPVIDAQIYAEAAGALIGAARYDIARQALGRAYDTDPKVPETAFQYARLFRWSDDAGNEERALLMAIDLLGGRKRLNARQVRESILARNALGELHYRQGEPLKAQSNYTEAIRALEDALAARRVKPSPDLGRVYANSADVHYYNDRDLDAALALYDKARGLGLADDDLLYKVGFIRYERQDYPQALSELHRVAQGKPDNPTALFALANTLYLRGDYLAAQGYYTILIRQLEARRQRIAVLQPRENAQHRDLLELTMRAFNNLGVTEKKVSQDSRAGGRENRANFYLQRSIEFYDQLTRNSDTLVRSEARNLGFINSRTLLYPRAGAELEIYRELPKNLETTRF